jgi:hypothetical protein
VTAESWIDAVLARHTTALTTAEFNRALRALSVRYVERRASLPARSPTDSAGKRSAFAAFYGPLHFLTTREIVRALGADARPFDTIVDLGCGTGVASAAWALERSGRCTIQGIDKDDWALGEAKWNWTSLGLRGRATRGDMVRALDGFVGPAVARGARGSARTAIVAGWSINELDNASRERLLPLLVAAASQGAAVLVIEPLARGVTPWWDDWAEAFSAAGGRADEWKFDVALPPPLARIDDTAGFSREGLGARTMGSGLFSTETRV